MHNSTSDAVSLGDILQHISDVHKAAYGFRPSMDFYSGMDSVDLDAALTELCVAAEKSYFEEVTVEAENKKSFELHIEKLINDYCAPRSDVMRWDMQADGVMDTNDRQTVETFFYDKGLSMKDVDLYTEEVMA